MSNLILIGLIIILLIYQHLINQLETFSSKNHIWMYWEDKPGVNKPNYLKLCYQTIIKNKGTSQQLHLLDQNSIYQYLPDLRTDLDQKCNIPQKADYIRLALLQRYGGIWLDSDIIIFRPLDKLFLLLNEYDFIGFGCHFKDCHLRLSGYPRPANWVLGSPKNGKLVTYCLQQANNILSQQPKLLTQKYHCLGRELLWTGIDFLRKNDQDWKYYHFNSQCFERDYQGQKITNQRLISNENIDQQCKNKMIFIPVYNTAPGFPTWFKNMTEDQILEQNILFSRLIRYALTDK